MRRTIHDLEAEVEKLVHSEQSFRIRNKQLEDEIRNLKTLKEVTSGAKVLSELALVSTDGYRRVVEMAIVVMAIVEFLFYVQNDGPGMLLVSSFFASNLWLRLLRPVFC